MLQCYLVVAFLFIALLNKDSEDGLYGLENLIYQEY